MKFRTIESIYEMKKSTIQIHIICKCELKYDLSSLIKKKRRKRQPSICCTCSAKKNVSQWLRAISDFIRKSMVTAVQIFNQSCRWHGKINWIGACKWVVVIPIYKPFMIYISRSNLHRPPFSSANQHDIMPWKIVLNMKFNIINFITMHEINGFAHDLI